MYQDLIRNELNEAAETLANFLKPVAKCFPAATAVPIATLCTLPKS